MKNKILWLAFVLWFLAAPVWAQGQAQVDTELIGALIQEQNVTFAVVAVQASLLNDKSAADHLIQSLEPAFGGVPVVLMVQNEQGIPSYYGRPDIAEFLSKAPFDKIPWKKYKLKRANESVLKKR